MPLPACHVPAPAIDRYLLPAGRPAANPPHRAATAIERWDRQTDGRTDRPTNRRTLERLIDPARLFRILWAQCQITKSTVTGAALCLMHLKREPKIQGRCCTLVNIFETNITSCVPAPLQWLHEAITPFTKPPVDKVLSKTDRAKATGNMHENFVKSEYVIFEICEGTNRQMGLCWSQYVALHEGRSNRQQTCDTGTLLCSKNWAKTRLLVNLSKR